jgi:hypothetical protein
MYTKSSNTAVVQPGEGNRLIGGASVKVSVSKLIQRLGSCPTVEPFGYFAFHHESSGGVTYAITHASAALALKRKFPRVGLLPLLISVQFVELLWILFTFLGIEHARITPDAIHLDFLPYSHSVTTGLVLAAITWGFGKAGRRTNVGMAIALGILSHILLDIIHHEPNIALLPMQWGPQFGLNLQVYPILDFLVELAFCLVCWAFFHGTRGLLIGIVIFNLLNIPFMFPRSQMFVPLIEHPNILPTLILVEVVATCLAVWWLGKGTILLEDAMPDPRI